MAITDGSSRKPGSGDVKTSVMDAERQRAMALGQFNLMGENDEKGILDDSEALLECVKEWKDANRDERKRVRIQYEKLQTSNSDDERSSIRLAKGYKMIRLPKMSDSFAVIWVTSRGHVIIEKDVVLLTMSDVIGVQEDHPNMYGPKGPDFGFSSNDAEGDESEFDKDLYWSVGFLHKHFKTCGLMKWDRQLASLRRDIKAKASKEAAEESRVNRKSSRGVQGKYQGKLIGWKGTYGFVECTSGDISGKSIFLHHSDISSPYLRLSRGIEMRFDVVKDEDDSQRLRAVKAHPCLCNYSCCVHEVETQQQQQPRRRKRSSKSSASGKNSSGVEAAARSSSDGGSPKSDKNETSNIEGGKRVRGKRRRNFNRRQRKPEVQVEIEG